MTTATENSNLVKFEKTKGHQRYKLSDGTPCPGVTTVLGVMDKPALIHWAWNLGMQQIDYKKVKDKAADIGTLAHFMCECHLKGKLPDISEFSPADVSKAENAYIKFLTWWDEQDLAICDSERQLVSPKFAFGGTLDLVAKDNAGKYVLIDLKTSKAIYDEYWCQVAAYQKLYEENLQIKIDRKIIVRIGKEEVGDFEAIERDDLSKHWNLFMACLGVYNAKKALK